MSWPWLTSSTITWPAFTLRAREAVAELLRDHLDARGRVLRLRGEDHAMSVGRVKEAAFGITAAASTPNHCSSSAA